MSNYCLGPDAKPGDPHKWGFSLEITPTPGKGENTQFKESSVQTFCSWNPNGNDWNWIINSSNQNYNFIEAHRFTTNDPSVNLSDYTIKVTVQPTDTPPPAMSLAVGDAWIWKKQDPNDKYNFIFDLSTPNTNTDTLKASGLASALSLGNSATYAVRSFTIQPYDDSSKSAWQGKRSIVLTTGPVNYNPTESTLVTGYTNITFKKASELTSMSYLEKNNIDLNGMKYDVRVGSFADYLLHTDNPNKQGPPNDTYAVSLQIDKKIDIRDKLLSQQVLYRRSDSNTWNLLTLGFDKQIIVTGLDDTSYGSALVDGSTAHGEYDHTNEYKFQNEAILLCEAGKTHNVLRRIGSGIRITEE